RELAGGTPAASGAHPRQLVEATSDGILGHALAAFPTQSQQVVADAAGEGFLAGLNNILTLGALLSFAGAVLAFWLVREREIERERIPPKFPQDLDTKDQLARVEVRVQPSVQGQRPRR